MRLGAKSNVLLALLLTMVANATSGSNIHSDPICWAEKRFVHEPNNGRYDDRLSISKTPYQAFDAVLVSPNKGYWVHARKPDRDNLPNNSAVLKVHNERDYLTEIRATDVLALADPLWVNEKLLLVEFWWGRKLATQLIFDVEAEKVVWQEMYRDGGNAFNQVNGMCQTEEWQDDEKCKCAQPS